MSIANRVGTFLDSLSWSAAYERLLLPAGRAAAAEHTIARLGALVADATAGEALSGGPWLLLS